MKLLLDTHVFLWFISGDSKLSTGMRDSICNAENEVYLSVVSIWDRDPFDRLLICQALQHNLKLVAVDSAIQAYSLQLLYTDEKQGG